MTTGQTIDMNAVMETLAKSRPVFHSESDFKHALSSQIQQDHPAMRIRQEFGSLIDGPDRRYVDVSPTPGPPSSSSIFHQHEEFQLRDQSAQDTRRYDFCLDISRLEGRNSDTPKRQSQGRRRRPTPWPPETWARPSR